MTKKEFQKNYRSLVATTNRMLRAYEKMALDSGAFELAPEDSSWGLPKDVITAALLDAAGQWAPNSWNNTERKRVKNIRAMTSLNGWSGIR